MRILLLNQFFAPDPAPTGQLLADVARALVADGHTVQVVCSHSPYAACDAYGHHGLENVGIHRGLGISFGRNALSRIASYSSFFVTALRHVMLGKPSDVVLTLTTPPLLSLSGTLAKIFRGSRHVIWEMDVYPDVAVALNVFAQGGLLDRGVGALADMSRRRADRIIALGSCMRQRLIGRGLQPDNITVAENWVDASLISSRPFPPLSPLTLLYSGNLGHAHDETTLAGAMARLTGSSRFRFVFAGGGSRRNGLELFCRERKLSNVEFLGYQSSQSFSDHLSRCHIGLVTQKPETCGTVVPSKSYSLMAAGRPFIFIGPPSATPATLIERFNCGWHIEPGDVSALVNLLELLSAKPELIAAAGTRARNAVVEHFDLPAGVSRVVKVLTSQSIGNSHTGIPFHAAHK